MLTNLTIKNIVLIESLTIHFENNLCALTGETGAGKSILLDSLGLALGARSDAGLVRQGADKASVTASFDLNADHIVFDILNQNDIEHEGEVILRRVLNADGRSKAFVNDQPLSVGLLKIIGQSLVEIHGQFDTHHLMNAATHIAMLDEYAGHDKDLISIQKAWDDWQNIKAQLISAQALIDKARVDEDYYRQSLEDLDALSPQIGEEESLSQLRSRLMRREQITENLNEAQKGLAEMESATASMWRAIDKLSDEEGSDVAQAMTSMNAEMQEVENSLLTLSQDLESNEHSLEEIDDRLYALKGQARKFNCGVDDLPAKRQEIVSALQAN